MTQRIQLFGAFAALLCFAPSAHAYLGSFEFGDGYEYGAPMGFNLGDNDVTRYNAGQFGTNNGGPGGPVTTIVPDSGLWRVITGGRLLNQANDYYVIRHSAPGGHTSANVLGMTTGNSNFVGVDSEYQYDFEARDFDGNAPASLAAGSVSVSFLWCPQNAAFSTLAAPSASIAFQDSAGTPWFELGTYAPTQSVSYRVGGGPWVAAGFNTSAAFSNFDSVSLTFDLAADTVSFSMFETAAATNHVVLTNAPLGGNMNYLAHMGLFMKAENTKNFLDDFDFQVTTVPEPGAIVVALLAFGGIVWRSVQ
jgi:hypothetical protein